MRIFSSELAHNYGTYTFGYTNYGELDEGDDLSLLYNAGFLPYSGSPDAPDTLYMARSARVVLPRFALTSENRRITKKFDGQFSKKRVPLKEFVVDEPFIAFCLEYFAKRHGAATMPRARLEFILASKFISDVIVYTQGEKPVACVLVMRQGSMEHYWFSFYDLSLTAQSLGLWLMLDCVRDAQAAGLEHYYVGTVYGEKALYKTNFEPLEWWSGAEWQTNVSLLKERGRSDTLRTVPLSDEWKERRTFFK